MYSRVVGVATCSAAVLSLACGCANNPFRTAQPAPPNLEPPPGVAAPAHTLPQPAPAMPSYADVDGRQLEAALSRSRQETQVMQDEITALRDQLASTSAHLARLRGEGTPAAAPAAGQANVPPAAPGLPPSTPAAMQAAVAELVLPGVDARGDGAVVRLDVPAEKLFEPGSAALVPGGAAILTQVAAELERVFPGHFVGIEGHLDTEPLQNASWGSAHQLTAARAAAVFDFLTARTRMHEGQLFLVAHGPNHPLVSNATAAGRSRNRRMELVVYPERSAPRR
ncbi:MAG: flagellar motor protein MotB [Planctomycetia bacterium]|jgi:flagellar motor protein MotB